MLQFSGSRHKFVRFSCVLRRRKDLGWGAGGFIGTDEKKLFSLTYLLSSLLIYLLNYLVTYLITFLSI